MAFNIGAFAGGLSDGIQRGTEIARKRQEMERIDAEEKRKSEYEAELKKHDDEYQAKRAERIKQNEALLNPGGAQPEVSTARLAATMGAMPSGIESNTPNVDRAIAKLAEPLEAPAKQPASVFSSGIAPAPMQAPVQAKKPVMVDTINDTLDYLMNRARIDMKYGKADAASVLQLHQVKKKLEDEGVDHAIGLMQAGDFEGGLNDFNSVGKYSGVKLVETKPVKAKIGESEIDGYEVTVEHPDGRQETINTVSYMKQRVGIDKLLDHAHKSATLKETERHNKATEAKGADGATTAEIKNINFLIQNGIAKTPAQAWEMVRTGKTPAGEHVVSDGMGGVMIYNRDSGQVSKIDSRGKESVVRQPGNGSVAAPLPPPKPGDVVDGHKFKGGNPKDKTNWEKV